MAHTNDTDETRTPETSEAERLLVDLLYGELEGDARESAEATVRGGELGAEYDALVEMRAMFRSLPDDEPPAAVTAKLLHAAAVHAPSQAAASPAKESAEGGLWARLRQLFQPVLAYPGLAAAASLVVVIGVAGLLYMNRGGSLVAHDRARGASEAPRTLSGSTAADSAAAPAPPGVATQAQEVAGDGASPGVLEASAATGEGVGGGGAAGMNKDRPAEPSDPGAVADFAAATGRDERSDRAKPEPARPAKNDRARRTSRAGGGRARDLADELRAEPDAPADWGAAGDSDDDAAGSGPRGGAAAAVGRPAGPRPTAPAAKGKSETTIEVRTVEPELKTLPEEDKRAPSRKAPARRPAPPAPARDPAPAPGQPAAEPAPEEASPSKPAAQRPRPGSAAARVRSLHDEAVIAARNSQCDAVASIGSKIRSQDAKYYTETFQRDSRLDACRRPPAKGKRPVKGAK